MVDAGPPVTDAGGGAEAPARQPDVMVIGAGCAGLAAAVRLADAGLRVEVVERAPRLGGRATAFTDRTTGERVDNGQHVLFGCYRETYQFLETIGSAHLAPLDGRLSLEMADRWGHRSRLECSDLPAPLHLVAGLFTWDALTLADCWSLIRMLPFFRAVGRLGAAAAADTVPAEWTVAQWLDSLGQGARLRAWLWDPLALAALNQSPAVASARVFARVLGEMFGTDPQAAAVGMPTVPLDELYAAPAARFIEARGGWVVKGAKRARRRFLQNRLRARFGTLCAVPWHSLSTLWESVPRELEDVCAAAAATASESIVSVNLWFDRAFLGARQVGLVGCRFDWVFSKKPSGGFFDEKASRRLFGTTMVASGAGDLVRRPNGELIELAVGDLHRAVPEARKARLRHAVVVREPRATFSVAPGPPTRPAPGATALPGFFLAGDWTNTGLPGTIEGAVRSGHAAADAVLATRR